MRSTILCDTLIAAPNLSCLKVARRAIQGHLGLPQHSFEVCSTLSRAWDEGFFFQETRQSRGPELRSMPDASMTSPSLT